LKRYGAILLMVPLMWTVLAGIAEKRARYIFSFGFWIILGTTIPATIIGTYFYAIFHPCIAVPN
jgi:hypothetical protein